MRNYNKFSIWKLKNLLLQSALLCIEQNIKDFGKGLGQNLMNQKNTISVDHHSSTSGINTMQFRQI
jgi:hypothetical protein